jgi:hypothetical protein
MFYFLFIPQINSNADYGRVPADEYIRVKVHESDSWPQYHMSFFLDWFPESSDHNSRSVGLHKLVYFDWLFTACTDMQNIIQLYTNATIPVSIQNFK